MTNNRYRDMKAALLEIVYLGGEAADIAKRVLPREGSANHPILSRKIAAAELRLNGLKYREIAALTMRVDGSGPVSMSVAAGLVFHGMRAISKENYVNRDKALKWLKGRANYDM